MSQSAALVLGDLGSVRLFGDAATRWDAPTLPGSEVTARSLRLRAEEAVRWISQQPGLKRRLNFVVVDVEEAVCAWLRTPSLAQPVLAATLRAHAQDWGDLMPVTSFETLNDHRPAPRGRGKKADLPPVDTDSGTALGVLCIPDAIVRLWLDALDRLNVRVGAVVSLWHAMAKVAATEAAGADAVVASVVIDQDRRLVWTWSQGGDLLCAGAVSLMRPAEPAADEVGPVAETEDPHAALIAGGRRLTLDWLTWSSHLGRVPERVMILGLGADKLGSSLKERFGSSRIDTQANSDPVAHVIEQFTRQAPDSLASDHDSRRVIAKLTHRPTRGVRWRYRWTAAMLALLGLCLAMLGQRLSGAGSSMITAATQVQQQTRDEARKEIPTIPELATKLELRTLLLTEAGKPVAAFKPPPVPRPIYEELGRVAGILVKYPEVRILGIAFDQEATGQCRLQVRAPDRRMATEVFEAIKGTGKPVEWQRQQASVGAAGAFDDLNLVGKWVD